MERKSIVIDIPDGMCIDESNSTFEKIVFKKKDAKPRSWEEYCCQQQTNCKEGYCINSFTSEIKKLDWGLCTYQYSSWRNVLPSKELTEAFLAMMQLISLRQAWIEGWNSNLFGYAIMLDAKRDIIVSHDIYHRALTFPDRNMAKDFMDCFKDLLEIAKPLL